MSYSYSVLEHPADIKLKIKADSKEELFKAALEGMAQILVSFKDITSKKISKKIKVSSLDFSSLIIDFLSEVLALTDIENSVFKEIKIKKLKDNEIEAVIRGFKINKFKEEIKAVTYHKAEIRQNEEGQFETEILFDI